jgi:alpha-galactosidase
MVNAMLFRIHQSGHLAELSQASFAQVKTGLKIYKERIRSHIGQALPYYPLGLPDITDSVSPVALGMRSPQSSFIAVWRLRGIDKVHLSKADPGMRILYPVDLGIRLETGGEGLTVVFPREMMACVLTLDV